MRTKYLVRLIARAEDVEDVSDFELEENGGKEEEINEEDEDEMVGRSMFWQRGRGRIKMIRMMVMMVERMTRNHPSDRVGPLLGFSRFFLFSLNSELKRKKCKMTSFQ